MEEAGRRFANGPFNLADVGVIVEWKSPRRMDRFKLKSAEEVEAAMVKLKMASAILTAMFPTLYTVCDFRASHALGVKDSSGLRFYIAYLAACREMAARYGVSLRDFDRANWQWSKDQSKRKKKECVGWAARMNAGRNCMFRRR